MTNQEFNQNNQGQLPQQQETAHQSGPVSHDQLEAAKQMAERQVDQAIDQFAQKIPGGAGYAQQAKDAAAGVLDNLESEAEKHMGDVGGMLGGLFGHHKDKQSNQG